MAEIKNEQALKVTQKEQYHTVDELFKRSQPGPVYYTLLVLSSFIIAAGLLLDNSAIVIGGMLVTPLLSPILVISLGIEVAEVRAIKSALWLILKSFLIVAGIAFIMAFLLGNISESFAFENTFRTAVLYFIVATAAGMAATFAWARKEYLDILPGIAIAVSLVPPLSLVGIWLSNFNLELVRFYFSLVLFNIIGIVVGSLVIFSLLKFHKVQKKVQEQVQQQVQQKKEEKKEEEKK